MLYLLNHLVDLDNRAIIGKLLVSAICLNNTQNLNFFIWKKYIVSKIKILKKFFFWQNRHAWSSPRGQSNDFLYSINQHLSNDVSFDQIWQGVSKIFNFKHRTTIKISWNSPSMWRHLSDPSQKLINHIYRPYRR